MNSAIPLVMVPSFWAPAAVALILSLAATAAVRQFARKHGIVAAPKTDRWHKKPTAMLGGVAIFVALNVTVVIFQHRFNPAILGASAFMFVVGLVDDLWHLKPYQKLIGQIIAAMIVVYSGLLLPWTSAPVINMAVTVFWLVGITNATNMLDNMDGLAGGVVAIGSVFLAINFLSLRQVNEAAVVISFAAVLVGFLVFNSNPASIFMGDCGSMFIGFFLPSVALLTTTTGRTRSVLPVIAVPVLTLVIPIFDTTFVTVLRKLAGRRASEGGRDHTSHRLVALGLSERRAVFLLYGLATLAGLLALKVRGWQVYESMAAILGFTIVLTMIGVYLAGVRVYDADAVPANRKMVSFLVDISYKRRIFEALLDLSLITLSYYLAYLLRFGTLTEGDPNFSLFIRTLPIVAAVRMTTFLGAGVYRGLWRYIGVHDVYTMAKSVVLGSLISVVAVVYLFRFENCSRGVFILDAVLLTAMMVGTRTGFRFARTLLPTRAMTTGRRVLIYGAGDAGELLLRELLNNEELHYAAVGFLDDDPRKVGKVIHGLRVFAGVSLATTCESLRAEEIVISSSKIAGGRIDEIVRTCDAIGIPLRQMQIQLMPINSWQTDLLLNAPAEETPAAPLLRIRRHGSTHIPEAATLIRPDRTDG